MLVFLRIATVTISRYNWCFMKLDEEVKMSKIFSKILPLLLLTFAISAQASELHVNFTNQTDDYFQLDQVTDEHGIILEQKKVLSPGEEYNNYVGPNSVYHLKIHKLSDKHHDIIQKNIYLLDYAPSQLQSYNNSWEYSIGGPMSFSPSGFDVSLNISESFSHKAYSELSDLWSWMTE